MRLLASSAPVDLTITGTGGTTNYHADTVTNSVVLFSGVTFGTGANTVTGTISEPSGNKGALISPCSVSVGNSPVVTWVTPVKTGGALAASSDTEPTTAGWQGNIRVCTDLAAVTPTPTITLNLNGP